MRDVTGNVRIFLASEPNLDEVLDLFTKTISTAISKTIKYHISNRAVPS